nr:hypothetical protein CFP56_56047 [Quercus suber]
MDIGREYHVSNIGHKMVRYKSIWSWLGHKHRKPCVERVALRCAGIAFDVWLRDRLQMCCMSTQGAIVERRGRAYGADRTWSRCHRQKRTRQPDLDSWRIAKTPPYGTYSICLDFNNDKLK